MTAWLRQQGAEVVVALTHLEMEDDAAVLRNLGPDGPDLIIGGHEHHKQARKVTGRWVFKADADGRTATGVQVTVTGNGPPQVRYAFRTLEPEMPVDPMVMTRVQAWLERHDREYCQKQQLASGCLDTPLGRTAAELQGEELEIRRYETNLGNWIADQARSALAGQGAQAAFLNAGSLCLNQKIPAGTTLTRRHVEELFAYPMPLKLLRIKGRVLQQVISHAVQDWTGNGWWLQVSGFAYRHNPSAGEGTLLTLLAPDRGRPITPNEDLCVATIEFLVDARGGQDGYTMLTHDQVASYEGEPVDLRQQVIEALWASRRQQADIAPQVEGRICIPQRPGPCLAADDGTSTSDRGSNDRVIPLRCGNL